MAPDAAGLDEIPEALAAHGVHHQVHARLGGIVQHPVLAPRVEDPALPGGHVDGHLAAFKNEP